MNDQEPQMPSFKAIAASLRETTEKLAAELVAPSDSPPAWNDLNWAVAPAAAAIQGISTLLSSRLKWSGPASWISFLDSQRRHATAREQKIDALLRRIDHAFSEAELTAVGLKGASLRELGMYSSGERPMSDIDLLVRPDQLDRVEEALAALDYRPGFNIQRHIEFVPPDRYETHGFGEHENNAIPIEVHTIVSESLPVRIVDITESLWPTTPCYGLGRYSSKSRLMLHMLLHAAAGIRQRAVRLIQLHDIALLAQQLDADDWRWIVSTRDGNESRWWLYPPLAVATRYFPNSVSATVLAESSSLCPLRLRSIARQYRISEISYANPRIPAFPGLTWARTPLEAIRFVRSRVFPGRLALSELNEALGSNHRLLQLPWYGVSHFERILRWITGRAPRVQTILSVHEALESFGEVRS